MRAARRIAGNTSIVLVGKGLGIGLSLATFFLLTGNLSQAEFGQYSFAFFYIGIFSVVADMGMSPILVREIARNRDRAGEILGAAGASGGTGDEDEAACAAGVVAAGFVSDPAG